MRYFKETDFACKCGRPDCNAAAPDPAFMRDMDALRFDLGLAMNLTSGSRCTYHNESVGGKPGSQHLLGRAADVAVPNGEYMIALVRLAIKHGFSVGIKAHMAHLDKRQGPPIMFGYP
jgi:hypothetical protein